MLLLFSLLVAEVTAKPYLLWPGQYGGQLGPWFVPRLQTQPVVISLDIDHECVTEGIFVNPEDCGSYITCNNNGYGLTPAKVSCPGQPGILAFNEKTGVCDWAANVEGCSSCLSRMYIKPEVSPVVAQEFVLATMGLDMGVTRRLRGIAETGQRAVVVDPFVDFTCTEEGIFMNPEDCGSYISCKNICREGIKAFKIGCPATLLFNTDLGVCDFAHNVPDCAQRNVETNDGQTSDGSPPQPAAIVAEPCNPAEGILPHGEPGPCFSAVIAENPHTFEEVEDPKIFDCSGKAAGTYPDPDLTVCDQYYVCTGDERTFRYDCAQGTFYSSQTGDCSIFAENAQCGA